MGSLHLWAAGGPTAVLRQLLPFSRLHADASTQPHSGTLCALCTVPRQASNWGELVGYVGSISLSVLRISLLLEREVSRGLLCWLCCCCAVASHSGLAAGAGRQRVGSCLRLWCAGCPAAVVTSHALTCLLLECAHSGRTGRTPAHRMSLLSAAPRAQVALIAELQRLQKEAAAAAGATAAGAAASAAAPAAVAPDPDLAAALKGLRTEIRLLRARRVLRTLGLVQDLADLLMVLAEVRPSKSGLLSRPAVLALAGLLSGCLSAYKNWPGH